MASTSTTNDGATENAPLIPSIASNTSPLNKTQGKHNKNVTFSPNPAVMSAASAARSSTRSSQQSPSILVGNVDTSQPSMRPNLNSKLRRRNSHGSPLLILPTVVAPKIGPQRTTKNAQKLKLLPNPIFGEDGPDEESGRDVYSQYTRIKDPTARRDAARLGKADRDRLPRVTAYCTANKYQMDALMRFLKGRGKTRYSNPKLFDECIYTPYNYGKPASERIEEVQSMPAQMRERRHSDSAIEVEDNNKQRREDLIDLHTEEGDAGLGNGDHGVPHRKYPDLVERRMEDEAIHAESNLDFDIKVHTPEVFLFDYGVVVIWGMSLKDEQRFLKEIAKFESEKLALVDIETECFNFYYTREYQARIYNDFITLRDKKSYMTKLAISHALAQSVKTSLFEALVDDTITTCKDIPTQIALTGAISMSRTQINMQIGELFILRINIHLNGSVLDTPELFWVEPQLEPIYQAVRGYLEMDQRVRLLTERLDVIADLLAVLKDQLSHGHGEKLEWIVIVLIAAEILVAAVNIVVDLYAGVA
ncbi:sporulation protein-like protein RMD1 [Amylocarpus encephaloides]|uniref:Sporulation protein-like protein RMD1 n=1 Tax=Amylocarpus encephaloides TaxID=45428 RepID=A0A9P7YNG3_9HELO|nr:sporulation protein-like protein RMD1 [Amylocarpus encephaloides]